MGNDSFPTWFFLESVCQAEIWVRVVGMRFPFLFGTLSDASVRSAVALTKVSGLGPFFVKWRHTILPTCFGGACSWHAWDLVYAEPTLELVAGDVDGSFIFHIAGDIPATIIRVQDGVNFPGLYARELNKRGNLFGGQSSRGIKRWEFPHWNFMMFNYNNSNKSIKFILRSIQSNANGDRIHDLLGWQGRNRIHGYYLQSCYPFLPPYSLSSSL